MALGKDVTGLRLLVVKYILLVILLSIRRDKLKLAASLCVLRNLVGRSKVRTTLRLLAMLNILRNFIVLSKPMTIRKLMSLM